MLIGIGAIGQRRWLARGVRVWTLGTSINAL